MTALLQTLTRLGPARLAALGAVGVGLLAFFVFLTGRLSVEDMTVLYGDLDPADSAKIVTRLESSHVPFELSPDGARILVPASKAARLRMEMAAEGLPAGGSIGYELFDKSSALGTTSFAQRINHLRALEGELVRSIRTLAPVQAARVHLVLPRREAFSRETEEPSASIIVGMRGNAQLSRAQVLAIQNLVAAAVPRLTVARISVVDDRGNLLARGDNGNDPMALSAATAEEMRSSYERRMARTIEQLLERSVGFGKVRAEVAVEMDFDRITTNSETFDPDQQVVRSTQTVTERNESQDGDGQKSVTVANNLPDRETAAEENAPRRSSRSAREEETVNYEISKTVKTHVREAGVIRRITAAVLVDGRWAAGPDGAQSYEPRSAEDLAKLAALVRSAIGFDEARGDKVEVVNMQFARPDEGGLGIDAPAAPLGLDKQDWFRIAEIGVLGILALLVMLLVVRPLLGRLLDTAASEAPGAAEQPLLPAQAGAPALAAPAALPGEDAEEGMIDISQVEGRVKASSVRQIGEIIDRHPEEAVGILRQWMHQES